MTQYQLLPALTAVEYAALKADIAARGVQVPVEYDEDGNILDGHHRVLACQELGLTDWPRIMRMGMSEQQKMQHVIALNLDRRHLNESQRAVIAAKLANTRAGGDKRSDQYHSANLRNDIGQPTAASMLNISERSLQTAKAIERDAPELLDKVMSGEMTLNRAMLETKQLPHVAQNSGDNEWYTPAEYIEAARLVLCEIDLDPASTPEANEVVRARQFYTAEMDGLKFPWVGRVWMNPPYASALIGKFCRKLVSEFTGGSVTEAIVLVNNATETQWFQALAGVASAILFPAGRVRYWQPDKKTAMPLQGQAIIYIGGGVVRFKAAFVGFGFICTADGR